MSTENWQRIEGAIIAAIALIISVMAGAGWSWWLWLVVLLLPDLSMAGYLAGPVRGAFVYNLFHLYASGLVLVLLGMLVGQVDLITLGLLWLAHVGIDRAIGFGLKRPEGFSQTHLGQIDRRR
ncbi:DUF4260 family protein [Paracoccus sp. (in: a-proteobacteria)]|uniref:DUF4260 family protein n=1 Tax=Paracoccus sp. TaxID=267 RepID=UPI0028A1AD96|nr:DUF4260 family protein [Paracoccus sp. (in: a-proteobacteria)]